MGIVLLTGITVISYAFHLSDNITAAEWLVFPLTLLVVNFGEYYAHRWLGHRKTRLGKLFYSRHTGDHHSFFSDQDMNFESVRDWRVVLFPAYLIYAFLIGLVLPVGFILANLVSLNVACLYAAGGITGYLFYEAMHFSYHLPEGSKTERLCGLIPGWKVMRQSHVLHHRRDLMHNSNFNITIPVFDFLLGTWHTED